MEVRRETSSIFLNEATLHLLRLIYLFGLTENCGNYPKPSGSDEATEFGEAETLCTSSSNMLVPDGRTALPGLGNFLVPN